MGRCQGSGQRGCFVFVHAIRFIDWDGKGASHDRDCRIEGRGAKGVDLIYGYKTATSSILG